MSDRASPDGGGNQRPIGPSPMARCRVIPVVWGDLMSSEDSATPPAPALPELPGIEPAKLPDASVAPPPLLDGIVRVKVPAEKIQPFLAKTPLFKNCPKEVIAKV